jgi:hypothetical protein
MYYNNIKREKDVIIMDEHIKEEFKVKGENVLQKVKELIEAGNVRKITIKDKDNNVILALPLTIGVIGAALAPMLSAVGAAAALLTECNISIERVKDK